MTSKEPPQAPPRPDPGSGRVPPINPEYEHIRGNDPRNPRIGYSGDALRDAGSTFLSEDR